jgi:hypothetical protein
MQQVLFTKEHGFCVLNNFKEPWKDVVLRALVVGEGFDPERVRSMALERWDGQRIPVITAERLSGHPASGGFDQIQIAQRLHACFPEAVVLIGTRDPDETKKSAYKQLVREGYLGKDLTSLDATDWKIPQAREGYFQHVQLVRQYQALFGPEQVVELPYIQLHREPQRWVQAMESAIGKPLDIALGNKHRRRINKSLSERSIRVERVMNYFRKTPLNPFPLVRLPRFIARAIAETAVFFGA